MKGVSVSLINRIRRLQRQSTPKQKKGMPHPVFIELTGDPAESVKRIEAAERTGKLVMFVEMPGDDTSPQLEAAIARCSKHWDQVAQERGLA